MSQRVLPAAPLALSQISAFEYAAVEPSLHVIPSRTKGLLGHAAWYEAKRCNHAVEDLTRSFQIVAGPDAGAVNTKHCVGVHDAQNDTAWHCSSVHCAWHCARDLPKVFVPSPYAILPAWSASKLQTGVPVLMVVLVVVVVVGHEPCVYVAVYEANRC